MNALTVKLLESALKDAEYRKHCLNEEMVEISESLAVERERLLRASKEVETVREALAEARR